MDYKIFDFGNMSLVYGIENGQATLTLVPTSKKDEILDKKMQGFWPGAGVRMEPSMQIGIEGDGERDNLSAGVTYKNREQAFKFGVPDFEYGNDGEKTYLIATYTADNMVARQRFYKKEGSECLVTYCEAENTGNAEIVLENLPSFTFSRLSPFVFNNYDAEIYVYKMLNHWSREGALVKTDIKDLGFEESWFGIGVRTHRFGQAGSMPANGYLPWVAVEDRTNGCVWAAEIEAPAAWQIEVCHIYNGISLSGGQGDFLSSHWKKKLKKGEKHVTRRAFLTVTESGLYQACDNIVAFKQTLIPENNKEADIPPVYNEYCYTWGNPTEESVERQLALCKDLGFGYFVIDAGWYCKEGAAWRSVGDWELNRRSFPSGLKKIAEKCEKYGISLGLWFEFESVSADSDVYTAHPDWALTYCGKPILNNGRLMLDMRKKDVINYLKYKVIDFVRENGIRYLKIDYNETYGIGVDGEESLGEGLRKQTEAAVDFYRLIRKEIPDIVIEICSSGGMRHEAVWQSLGNLCSFSDAHEGFEGVAIAANLHRFIPPRQMLVWAVIKDTYCYDEVVLTLVKSLLGRPCLSGNPGNYTDEVKKCFDFYGKIKDIITDGHTLDIRSDIISFIKIQGSQIVKRASADGNSLLVYCFGINAPYIKESVSVSGYYMKEYYGNLSAEQNGETLTFIGSASCALASVALLEKR